MNMDKNKNVKTVHIDNEEDLFKVLEGLSILAGFTPPSTSKNKKAEQKEEPHKCSCGGDCNHTTKTAGELAESIYKSHEIILPIIDGSGREKNQTCPTINYFDIGNFIDGVKNGETNNLIINAGDADTFISIPLDEIDSLIGWLSDVKALIKSETNYFDDPVEMTRAEIEKILGHKFILCD
jgi:hypothetical protein